MWRREGLSAGKLVDPILVRDMRTVIYRSRTLDVTPCLDRVDSVRMLSTFALSVRLLNVVHFCFFPFLINGIYFLLAHYTHIYDSFINLKYKYGTHVPLTFSNYFSSHFLKNIPNQMWTTFRQPTE